MRIDSSSYALAASHRATVRDESTESLRIWRGARRPETQPPPATSVTLSAPARAMQAAATDAAPPTLAPPQSAEAAAIEEAIDAVEHDPLLQLIRAMIEWLTGESVQTISTRDLRPEVTHDAAPSQEPQQPPADPPPAGFGIEYDYHAVHEEFEQTRVSAEGSIKTTDGKEIAFKLELSMTRSYREETSISFRAGDAVRKDPLVLNFNGAAAQLSERRFNFDLDGNGTAENLAMLAGGSGYLAIDRNLDGKINSGRELFGPATNSGFGELAALDTDGNRWIDENDSAFAALRIWTPDEDGNGALESLARRQVGAIGVDQVASPFELRGAGNSNLGAVAATGIYLTEDGIAGSVQEVHLTV